MADELVNSSRFRDGSYGDELCAKLEWAMQQAQEIVEANRAEDPKVAVKALEALEGIVQAQAKLLGIGVPRSGGKLGITVNVGRDMKPGDLNRLIDAFQRTSAPALPAAKDATVEVAAEEVVERSGED